MVAAVASRVVWAYRHLEFKVQAIGCRVILKTGQRHQSLSFFELDAIRRERRKG